jgi:hypothetical protein
MMPFSGVLRHGDVVRTDVSGERGASIIRVTRIGKVGTTLIVTSKRRTLHNSVLQINKLSLQFSLISFQRRRSTGSATLTLVPRTGFVIKERANFMNSLVTFSLRILQ